MNFILHYVYAFPMLYLDPGSGSFLIQLLLAVVLGLGVAVRMYWAKIKSFFSGKKADISTTVEEKDEER